MKLIILIAGLLWVSEALSDEERWINFKTKFHKSYKSVAEEKSRFEVFQENLKTIEEHNAKYKAGKSTYTMGVNQFADLSDAEFRNMLRRGRTFKPKIQKVHETNNLTDIPDAFDWRDRNAVLTVRSQGFCASSWAFSATGALEGQNIIINNNNVLLSAQQLIDCSDDYGNNGCTDGDQISSFEYVQFEGINTDRSYPYTSFQGERGTCSPSNNSHVTVTGYRTIAASEEALKNAVATIGPISVNIYFGPARLYQSGVFSNDKCVSDLDLLDYSALVVGYGTEPATDTTPAMDFWSIKMSYDDIFGENGYFRLVRGVSQCGVALDTSYPVIAKTV